MVITISCPSCHSSFPVDPAKIPEGGVKVRCSTCAHVFRVERPEAEEPVGAEQVGTEADRAEADEPVGAEQAGTEADRTEEGPAEDARPDEPHGDGGAGGDETLPDAWMEEPGAGPAGADEPGSTEGAAGGEGWTATGDGWPEPAQMDEAWPEPGAADDGWPETASTDDGWSEPAAADDGWSGIAATDEGPTEPPVAGEGSDQAATDTTWPEPGASDAPPTELDVGERTPETSEPAPFEAEADADPASRDHAAGEAERAATADDAAISGAATPDGDGAEAPIKGFTFGKRDPSDKARRLARVLVSDMIMYNAERHQIALEQGTLAEDFEEEIDKSWKEFVEQVGPEMADGEGRGYWTQALNEILAKGRPLF